MTSTLTKAVDEWNKVFPCQATETYTGSVTFIKQLTVVAVSTITYLKNAFPEDNYTIDQFGGLKIRVLKKKCDDELAQFLMTALTQAFEAFDKKYLHQIALCFYEERYRPENLVEYHLFEYGYGAGEGEGASLSVRSAAGGGGETSVTLDAVRDRTVMLLRACMVMSSHTRLPKTYDVSLRIYYNDDAPEDYQAPGFSAAAEEAADEVAAGSGRVRLGSVSTPFHRVQLHTFHRDMRVEASPSTTVSHQLDELASSGCEAATSEAGSGCEAATSEAGSGCEAATCEAGSGCEAATSEAGSGCEAATCEAGSGCEAATCEAGSGCEAATCEAGAAAPPAPVRCECGRADTQPHMLLCGWCGCLQHAVCYGVRPAGPAPPRALPRASPAHCCVPCAEPPLSHGTAGVCTDAGLLRASNRRCYAIFRRALWWVWSRAAGGAARVSAGAAAGALAMDAPSARKLLHVLRARGIVAQDPPADTETEVDVVPAQLETALERFFHAPPSPCAGSDAPLPSPPAPRKRKQPARAPRAVGVKTKRMKKAD